MRTMSDLFDFSIHFISFLFISLIYLFFLSPSTSSMLWITSPRTSAEELGTLTEKNSTGYKPNGHFITEALDEQRFPEDFDYDDVTIGKTLSDACRRRADHSEEEGLSSCLASSTSHDRTRKPVVCRDINHERCQEIQRRNSENEQIRTLLDRQREQILADC